MESMEKLKARRGDLLLILGFAAATLFQRLFFLNQIKTPIATPDTPSYFQLTAWGNQRLYTVPIFFRSLNSPDAIVIGQILVGVVTWLITLTLLLYVLSNCSIWIKATFTVSLGLLSTSTPTFISDFYLMSESLNISLSLLFIVTICFFRLKPNYQNLFLLTFVYLVWLFAKQAHALTSLLPLFGLLILISLNRKFLSGKFWISFLAVLVFFNALAYLQIMEPTPTALWNTLAIVYYFIAKNQSWMAWFYENGWPRDYVTIDSFGNPDINNAIANSPNSEWLNKNGVSTFKLFLLQHPEYVLFGAFFLPLIGGSIFSWSETVGSSLIFGSRWNNSDFPTFPGNHLNYWWFDDFRTFIVFILFQLGLLSIVFFIRKWNVFAILNSQRLIGLCVCIIFFILAKANFEWLVAPGDRQRIWPEHGTAIRLCIILIFADLVASLEKARQLEKGFQSK